MEEAQSLDILLKGLYVGHLRAAKLIVMLWTKTRRNPTGCVPFQVCCRVRGVGPVQ